MALHFQQKREHLQAILPRDVHFDERTLTFLHRIDNIDLRNSASGRTVNGATMQILARAYKMEVSEYLFYLMQSGAAGIVPAILWLTGTVRITWPSVICVLAVKRLLAFRIIIVIYQLIP